MEPLIIHVNLPLYLSTIRDRENSINSNVYFLIPMNVSITKSYQKYSK